jgi:iron-sulfur cluster repair di-iron protein
MTNYIWITVDGRSGLVPVGMTLHAAAQKIHAFLPHACVGHAMCGTCRVRIEKGENNLSPMLMKEEELLKRLGHDEPNVRLACQAVVLGPVDATIVGTMPEMTPESTGSAVAETADRSVFKGMQLWTPDELVDYIMFQYHDYSRSVMPSIENHLITADEQDIGKHPELKEIARLFSVVRFEFELHLRSEEEKLFPYLRQLWQAKQTGQKMQQLSQQVEQQVMTMVQLQHEAFAWDMNKIKRLTSNYTPPPDASTEHRRVYNALAAFDANLHQHTMLEDEILYPKIKMLEADLKRSGQFLPYSPLQSVE